MKDPLGTIVHLDLAAKTLYKVAKVNDKNVILEAETTDSFIFAATGDTMPVELVKANGYEMEYATNTTIAFTDSSDELIRLSLTGAKIIDVKTGKAITGGSIDVTKNVVVIVADKALSEGPVNALQVYVIPNA